MCFPTNHFKIIKKTVLNEKKHSRPGHPTTSQMHAFIGFFFGHFKLLLSLFSPPYRALATIWDRYSMGLINMTSSSSHQIKLEELRCPLSALHLDYNAHIFFSSPPPPLPFPPLPLPFIPPSLFLPDFKTINLNCWAHLTSRTGYRLSWFAHVCYIYMPNYKDKTSIYSILKWIVNKINKLKINIGIEM